MQRMLVSEVFITSLLGEYTAFLSWITQMSRQFLNFDLPYTVTTAVGNSRAKLYAHIKKKKKQKTKPQCIITAGRFSSW